MSVRTATKKVGGFRSGHSCHPLGWQNWEGGQVSGQHPGPPALEGPQAGPSTGGGQWALQPECLASRSSAPCPQEEGRAPAAPCGQGPWDVGQAPSMREGPDGGSPPSRAATSPCSQQGRALWGPSASAPPPRHPQPSAPDPGAPHSPARCPGGTGCPPSPSPGSAAGSGPGLPHSLKTGVGVRTPPEPHTPTRQEPRGCKRRLLTHLPSPGTRPAPAPRPTVSLKTIA